MRQRDKQAPTKSVEEAVRDIRPATRRHFSAEEKIRIVPEGLRGEDSIAELCRKEGIGIPALELQAIFDEFHQLDNPARERSKGLGLGLAIVQRLADLLGLSGRGHRPLLRARRQAVCHLRRRSFIDLPFRHCWAIEVPTLQRCRRFRAA
jgi:hypothetical protein